MILNVNKPKGITSHDVVDEIRTITGERRVGHAGTLDPFAQGVLVVATGREDTRRLREIAQGTEKEYAAVLELGTTSDTGDPDGILARSASGEEIASLPRERIQEALSRFRGRIRQTPPAYSAVKIKGVRAYKLARKGMEAKMEPRTVSVSEIELQEFSPPFLRLRIVCGPGTYIRALARDIGDALGTGAYVKELTRTRVGDYRIEDSKTPEELRNAKGPSQ